MFGLRRDQNITQKDMADRLAIKQNALRNIEKDRLGASPSEDLVISMAGVLDMGPDDLLIHAGHFDTQKLQEAVSDNTIARQFFVKIQNGEVTLEDWHRIDEAIFGGERRNSAKALFTSMYGNDWRGEEGRKQRQKVHQLVHGLIDEYPEVYAEVLDHFDLHGDEWLKWRKGFMDRRRAERENSK